jgi:hypothetical protein
MIDSSTATPTVRRMVDHLRVDVSSGDPRRLHELAGNIPRPVDDSSDLAPLHANSGRVIHRRQPRGGSKDVVRKPELWKRVVVTDDRWRHR